MNERKIKILIKIEKILRRPLFFGVLLFLGCSILTNIEDFPLDLVRPADFAYADTGNERGEEDTTYDYYVKYKNYLNYTRRKNYRKYKKYKDKYGFDSSQEKALYKDRYEKYKIYKKDPSKYPQYAQYWDYYKKYRGYKNYYKKYQKYGKYKKYNKAKYAKASYAKYGKKKYKNAHDRYQRQNSSEANLGGGSLGPDITVGLWAYSKSDLRDDPFKIKALHDYKILNHKGTVIGHISADTITKVSYVSGGTLRIYDSISETTSDSEVFFEAENGDDDSQIFDVYRPSSPYDQYRGKIKLKYNDTTKEIWVINTLPLEHYIWGMGEITGTGDMDHNRVMTTAFRTYGYWKIEFSTKYAVQGFKVRSTSDSQIYYGYDWEIAYPRIKEAAIDTHGKIVMYDKRIALTPYSSWTDGRTRSFKERWGSDNYPWCQSVKDPYGKHPTMSTKELENAGNHMVGLSAHGSLNLAEDHGWDWEKILNYYFDDIDIKSVY